MSIDHYKPFPFKVPSPERFFAMTPKEGIAFCAKFVETVASRIKHLESLIDLAWVYSRKPASESGRSLGSLEKLVRSSDAWEYHERAGQHVRVMVLNPAVARELKQIEKQAQEQPTWELSEIGVSLGIDLGILAGEYIRVRYPWTAWRREDRRSDLYYNTPCVGWFGGEVSYAVSVRQYGCALIQDARERSVCDLVTKYLGVTEVHAARPPSRRRWLQ